MKNGTLSISELINELESAQKYLGDVPIVISEDDCYYSQVDDKKIEAVTINGNICLCLNN